MIRYYPPKQAFDEIIKPAIVDGKLVIIELSGNPFTDKLLTTTSRKLDMIHDSAEITNIATDYVLFSVESAAGKPALKVFNKKYLGL